MANNDDKILQLQGQIEKKEAELAGKGKFTPVTTCSIELDGERHNLHAANVTWLPLFACKLEALRSAANVLNIAEPVISGFSVSDWITDVLGRLDAEKVKAEKANLAAMKKKLATLLSDDKQTELEIDAIAKALS